jgi:antirestriction protein ArdC
MSVPLAYDVVTDRIVEALERGTVPWRQPWTVAADGPRNIDGRPYRGINVWLLLAQGFGSPYWLTFNQCKAKGGHVRRGEHATPVVFWKQSPIVQSDAESGEQQTRTVPILRYYNCFNLEQCDGIAARAGDPHPELDPIAEAESIIAAMPNPPGIRVGGDRAAYVPALDLVMVPPLQQFQVADAFYSTCFHELGHSSGHASRLAREAITNPEKFGSMNYGREELAAEMTAAYLCGMTGILPATIDNSTAYLANWIATIEQDRKAVVVAAGAAQRAADYILGLSARAAASDEAA